MTDLFLLLELVLLVPSASSEGSQRISLTTDISYNDALETIYDIVGCLTITKKPSLSYRLSSSTQKSDPVRLASIDDWEGCLEDVAVAEGKKKGLVVMVKILITDVVRDKLLAFSMQSCAYTLDMDSI
jgi:hypothetical protein